MRLEAQATRHQLRQVKEQQAVILGHTLHLFLAAVAVVPRTPAQLAAMRLAQVALALLQI